MGTTWYEGLGSVAWRSTVTQSHKSSGCCVGKSGKWMHAVLAHSAPVDSHFNDFL